MELDINLKNLWDDLDNDNKAEFLNSMREFTNSAIRQGEILFGETLESVKKAKEEGFEPIYVYFYAYERFCLFSYMESNGFSNELLGIVISERDTYISLREGLQNKKYKVNLGVKVRI